MRSKHILVCLFCGAVLMTASCKKFLQLQPEGAYTEGQVFDNEMAVQQALNGLYINMASNSLYGATLTQTYIESMAHNFKPPAGTLRPYSQLLQYQYNNPDIRNLFETVWSEGYSTIMSANLFMTKIEGSIANGVVSAAKANLMKGEALAVRAFLHFDLLRLFGPVPGVGTNQTAIPYYTAADAKAEPILNAAEVVNRIITDLIAAEALLEADPIKMTGVDRQPDFYSGHRNQRLNYFAVKALKARVYLWSGQKELANAEAKSVLEKGEQFFPWLPFTSVIGTATPDRVFSTELVFALYNPQLHRNHMDYFSASLVESLLLYPETVNLRNTYENNDNDYRYASSWRQTTKAFRTFFKYEEIQAPISWRFLQPMIRKSELYYILAETDTDAATALGYLNSVRANRGLAALAPDTDLQNEIRKEYSKEFYGEGQLFYYYKRKNTATIPNAVPPGTVAPSYIVPLPLSETTPR